jgi:hypothetical protein
VDIDIHKIISEVKPFLSGESKSIEDAIEYLKRLLAHYESQLRSEQSLTGGDSSATLPTAEAVNGTAGDTQSLSTSQPESKTTKGE